MNELRLRAITRTGLIPVSERDKNWVHLLRVYLYQFKNRQQSPTALEVSTVSVTGRESDWNQAEQGLMGTSSVLLVDQGLVTHAFSVCKSSLSYTLVFRKVIVK